MGESIEPQSAYDAVVAEGAQRARPRGRELGRVALLKSQLLLAETLDEALQAS